ncbi:TIGR01777 family protein [Prolixibacteraceae bacterium JC049]|nr:TIGR01777 family protein [Prolixibacteraceae bacterium JC049]
MEKCLAISGGNGFIGKHLVDYYISKGWVIIRLNRDDLYGKPEDLAQKIEKCKVVIHLAGAPIFTRWTENRKQIFYKSRIETTKNVVKAFAILDEVDRPKHLINASAIGIYKSGISHDESSTKLRTDFLGKLIKDWEASAFEAQQLGVKVSALRFGMVFGDDGGAYEKMLKIYRWGLGANLGSGNQNVVWIGLTDVQKAVDFIIKKGIEGAINLVAPQQLSYGKFHRKMALFTSRFAFIRVPSFMVRWVMGTVAQEVLETPTVKPQVLLDNRFEFSYPDMDAFLKG